MDEIEMNNPVDSNIVYNIVRQENINPKYISLYFECKNLDNIIEKSYHNIVSSDYYIANYKNGSSEMFSYIIHYYPFGDTPILTIATSMSRKEHFLKFVYNFSKYLRMARRKFVNLDKWKSDMKMSSYKCSCHKSFTSKNYFLLHKKQYCNLKHPKDDPYSTCANSDLQDDRELRKETCCFEADTCKCHKYTNRYALIYENTNPKYPPCEEKQKRKYELCNTLTRAGYDFNNINDKLRRIQYELLENTFLI